MYNVRLTATYRLNPRAELLIRGIFAYYHDNNWNDTANAIQGAGTTAISILTPGYSSPNYSVGMLMAGIRIKL
jgi:Putative outer membrane beta-barrel porin, MtrB/PioB